MQITKVPKIIWIPQRGTSTIGIIKICMAQPCADHHSSRNGTKATPENTLSLHLKYVLMFKYSCQIILTSYRSEDFQIYVRGFSRRLYVSCRLPKESNKSFRTFCTTILPSDLLQRTWSVSRAELKGRSSHQLPNQAPNRRQQQRSIPGIPPQSSCWLINSLEYIM